MEQEEDWLAHLRRTMASLAPEGHMETVLGERVALLLWRLDRLARYEREAVVMEQENAGDAATETTAAAQYKHVLELVQNFPGLDGATRMSAEDATWLVETAAERADVDIYEDKTMREPTWAADAYLSEIDWTAAQVREYLDCIAVHAKRDASDLWDELAEWTGEKAAAAESKRQLTLRNADRHRRSNLVASEVKLAKITRYESSLERSLYKALHELQRIQAARQGQVVPPPVAIDVTGPDHEDRREAST
jgi:hypothetical protein